MELLYTQPGVKYIDEPLHPGVARYYRDLRISARYNYITVSPDTGEELVRYLRDERATRKYGPVRLLDPDYKFRTWRRVIKEVRCTPLVPWFSSHSDFRVLYLIRHPLPQAASSLRRGHRCSAGDFLADGQFVGECLSIRQVERAKEILRGHDDLSKYVLAWTLENLRPVRTGPNSTHWFSLTYEELTWNPAAVLERLAQWLSLDAPERMLGRLQRPSKVTDSSTEATVQGIRDANASYLVQKWRGLIGHRDARALLGIPAEFGVDVYPVEGVGPAHRWQVAIPSGLR
jgi:hypothetical protein